MRDLYKYIPVAKDLLEFLQINPSFIIYFPITRLNLAPPENIKFFLLTNFGLNFRQCHLQMYFTTNNAERKYMFLSN